MRWEPPGAAVLDVPSSQEGPQGTPAGTEGTAVTASIGEPSGRGKSTALWGFPERTTSKSMGSSGQLGTEARMCRSV